jgi:hypothetical protein
MSAPNTYYQGESLANVTAALAQDIPALYAGGSNSANPSAEVGAAAVNGVATTYMRSDAAPALNLAVAPTMTGSWTFTPAGGAAITITQNNAVAGLLINGSNAEGLRINTSAANGSYLQIYNSGTFVGFFGASAQEFAGGVAGDLGIGCASGKQIVLGVNATIYMTMASTGSVKFGGNVGVNGNAPPAQSTGWGTPTSPAVVNNFSGSAATNAQVLSALAEIITVLKAFGLLGT